MKEINKFINTWRFKHDGMLKHLHESIQCQSQDGKPWIVGIIDKKTVGTREAEVTAKLANEKLASFYYNLIGAYYLGPKLFVPNELEFQALAQAEIRIPINLFAQPFDSFFVCVPESCRKSITANGKNHVMSAMLGRWSKENNTLVVSFIASDISLRTECYYFGKSNEIEDVISKETETMYWDSIDDNLFYIRAYFNCCMLLTNYDAKLISSANPEYEASLRATLSKKKIPDSVRRAAEEALHNLPMIYGFDQSVRIYETEDGPHNSTGTGSPVKPHWRRGHWRHQPYGKEMGLRKLIFIPAVLVNSHRFTGDLSDTRVTYHTAAKS